MKVELNNIVLKYYGEVALKIDHLEFDANFGVTGFGGSGKTNLLKVIAGMEYIESGAIFFDGKDVTALLPKDRRIALISSMTPLFKNKTAGFNLLYPLKKHKQERQNDYSGIEWIDVKVKDLDERQIIELVVMRSLVRAPGLLLIDEPCTFIEDVDYFNDKIKELAGGTQIIYASYDPDNFDGICEKFITLPSQKVQTVTHVFPI